MSALIIVLVALPLSMALVALLLEPRRSRWQGGLALVTHGLNFGVLVALSLAIAPGTSLAVTLGGWPAPWGIELRVDGLALVLLWLTALVMATSLGQGRRLGAELRGRHYHALMHVQLMGLNGAFLTADLFNLFVFFEVLLLASYGLLLFGDGERQLRPGLHYVVLNLFGSALFLLGVSLVFGATGTLNMADVAARLDDLQALELALARLGLALLSLVFIFKAGVGPLGLWLPGVYVAAPAEVVGVFALMTKVGIYALLRLDQSVLLPAGVDWQPVPWPVSYGLGLAGMLLGGLTLLAARRLSDLIAALVLSSSGTLLCLIALAAPAPLAATLYYLMQSTLLIAALYLLANLITQAREPLPSAWVAGAALPGGLRPLLALILLSQSGLPPFAGFMAKLNVLVETQDSPYAPPFWGLLLLTGLVTLLRSSELWLIFGGRPPAGEVRSRVPGSAPVWALALIGLGIAALASPLQHYVRLSGQASVASLPGSPATATVHEP